MNIKKTIAILIIAIALFPTVKLSAQRIVMPFDTDWKFIKEDASGAEKNNFNDAAWKNIAVPHDWSIEGPYDRNNISGRGGGYLPTGIGFYRKSFLLNDADAKKRIAIAFDGVMANSDVWINGFHLGKRPYGYIGFNYDMTGHLNFGKGKTNVLAVRADNSVQPASRYYTGAGIYRHVRLVKTDAIHIQHLGGVYITSPAATAAKATVKIQVQLQNQSKAAQNIVVQTSIFDAHGKSVATTETTQNIAAGKDILLEQQTIVTNPALWNLENRTMYQAVTKVMLGQNMLDELTTPFGIRTIRFDADKGFFLNDKNIKLKGVCLHHDGGAVGAAVPLDVWKQRFDLLKQVGVNAIRTSHNPVAPEFLDLCDAYGFLVMDETFDTWSVAKHNGEQGYNRFWKDWWQQDTKDMVLRDRNHPAIVLYSVGNEIHDNLNDAEGLKKYLDQQDLVHSLDASRFVTMALFRPGLSHVYENGFVEKMDVVGQNYRENELVAIHQTKPNLKVMGTENGHTLTAWLAIRDNAFMAGQFLWTGFDYLGEEDWPNITNSQGLFDRSGGWRPLTYQRQSWWSDKPMVKVVRKEENAGVGPVVANWTPTDFDTYDDARVQVYSNCDEVELFLNGKSQGSKTKPTDDAPRNWELTFEKGTIKAVGKNNGKEVATDEMKTAGVPAKIWLSVSKSNLKKAWDNLVFVTATVVDENGIPCPNADNQITFTTDANGVISAVDNGNIATTELYQTNQRKAYKGRCIALVKANAERGKMMVTAAGTGLQAGKVEIIIE